MRPPVREHAERLQRAFARQAAAFEDPSLNRAFATGMEWLFEPLRLRTDDLLLDVAAGTGQAARALAPLVRAVVALDATPAMLDEGQAQARREGLRSIVFQRGDAARLPFLDGSFDVVVCRFAAHHFEDPVVQAAEMRRCLRPGGRLALADLVAAPEPPIAAEQNRLERLRDPSHTRMLTPDELAGLVVQADVVVDTVVERERERPLEPWLALTGTDPAAAEEIRSVLRAELAGMGVSGMRPRELDGKLHFSQRFASVIGHRAEV